MFKISSAFPVTHKGTYWLPKPLTDPLEFMDACGDADRAEDNRTQFAKPIKRTRLITREAFGVWVKSESSLGSMSLVASIAKDRRPVNENVMDALRPQNTLDRYSNASQLYHSGATYYDNREAGVYFILKASPVVKETIIQLLELIQRTSGLGGNRSSGLGAIQQIGPIEEADLHWDFLDCVSGSNAWCALSLYYPNPSEAYIDGALAYSLVLRKGWTGSLSTGRQCKRKTVRMFGEGSVFRHAMQGGLVCLTPTETLFGEPYPHPVYRYGYTLAVPIKTIQKETQDEGNI